MIVGGDLGFWLRLAVAGFAVLFGPVVGFVVRRKWRRAAERREEIKRLCDLASEEEALAELEATTGYGYGYSYNYGYDDGYGNGYGYGVPGQMDDRPIAVASGESVDVPALGSSSQTVMLHPCAVCSCLTKLRCKQCKAIHYCSSKCQIIHWRQGHKDECLADTTSIQKNDLGVTSPLLSKVETHGNHDTSVEIEGHPLAKPDKARNGEPAILGSVLEAAHERTDGLQVERIAEVNGRYPTSISASNLLDDISASNCDNVSPFHASHDSGGSDRHLATKVDVEKIHTGHANIAQPKPSISEDPILVSSVDSNDALGRSSQIKPVSVGGDRTCAASASSNLGVGGTIKSSLCEPSTSSSGFWEGKLVRNKSRIDSPDDICHSCFNEADQSSDAKVPMRSSLESYKVIIPQLDKSNLKNLVEDMSQHIMVGARKSTDDTSLPVKDSDSVSRKPPNLTPERLSNSNVSGYKTKPISGNGKLVPPASDAKMKTKSEGIFMGSNLASLGAEKLIYESESKIRSLHKLEVRELDSNMCKATEAPLSSNTGRNFVQSRKMEKCGNGKGGAACLMELSSHHQNNKDALKTSARKVDDQSKASTLTRQYTVGAGSEIMGRYKGLYPYELFVKLYNWNKCEFRPCGLVNCGNSCYANAVLQCLAFTPPLTSYFLQGLHSKTCKKKDWCFTCEFESLILKAKEGTSPLSPIRIISHLQNIGSHLGNGKEEDAHEFLRFAIDAMQSIFLKEAGIKESGSLEEETTLIGLTFGGYLRSKIECMRCGGQSERRERMMDLTVEIDGNIGSLEQALQQFTRAETLDGDNKYQCGRCKSYEKARKKLKVLEAPNVLTIVLKRFQSGKFGKLNKTIKFPEILNLAPYICGTSDKSPIYRLYAVVVHLDMMNAAFSGHYVCYVKNIQNKWFKVDDSRVKAVELENVLTKGAYMLLYARCSPRAPKLIRNSIVPRDPRITKHHTCKGRSLSTSSWGLSAGDSLNGQTCHECINSNHAEDDSSSDHSTFFSEVGSCSTESSNRDSTGTDDHFDLGEMGVSWNNPSRNSSDSDTSSSSSSSPSPLFLRRSPLADSERYASESRSSCIDDARARLDGHGIWRSASSSSLEASNGKEDVHFSCPGSTKQSRNLVFSSSSSSRETEAIRIGRIYPFEKEKSGASFVRSASERTRNILL